MKAEKLYVVDAFEVVGEDLIDEVSARYQADNNSYHRYYPASEWNYLIKSEIKEVINAGLLKAGVVFPEVLFRDGTHPDGYFNFYVLLHFSW